MFGSLKRRRTSLVAAGGGGGADTAGKLRRSHAADGDEAAVVAVLISEVDCGVDKPPDEIGTAWQLARIGGVRPMHSGGYCRRHR